MKTKLVVLLVLFAALGGSAFGQGFRFDNTVTQQGTIGAVTNALVVPAGSQIAFCAFPANAVPCTNKATTYTSNTLGTPCSTSTQIVLVNTTTCIASPDAQGNWGLWVPNGQYAYTITLPGGINLGPYNITLGISAGTSLSIAGLTTTGPNVLAGGGSLAGTFTGNPTFSGNPVFSGTAALSNAGVFTNTQFNEYLTSSINGCSSGAQYRLNPINPNTPFVTEALAGCVTVPVGATVVQANGISGFTNTSSTVTNAVGVYGQARAGANNVTEWGANFVTDDCPGGYTLLACNSVATGTSHTGIEIDQNANHTTTAVQGLTIGGLWNAQPATTAFAIRIHRPQQAGACTVCAWIGGLTFDGGATTGGTSSPAIFLPIAAPSGSNVASQSIRFESNDPVSGQNEIALSETATGDLSVSSSKIGRGLATRRVFANGTNLVNGDFAFSAGFGNTPSPSIATLAGTDSGFFLQFTAGGAGLGANPTVTLTFHDGTWTNAPVCVPSRGDASAPAGGYWAPNPSATALVLTFVGTPVASTGYSASVICQGKQN